MRLHNYTFIAFFLFLLTNCSDKNKIDNNNSSESMSCCEIPVRKLCTGGAYLFVPNVFTPNGDFINEHFMPQLAGGFASVSIFIFNLDGNSLFTNEDIVPTSNGNYQVLRQDAWDGEDIEGNKINGLFRYQIDVINLSGESNSIEGIACSRAELPLPCLEFEKNCAYGNQHNGQGGFDHWLPSDEPDCE